MRCRVTFTGWSVVVLAATVGLSMVAVMASPLVPGLPAAGLVRSVDQ